MNEFYNYFKNKYGVDLGKYDDEALLDKIFCIAGDDGVEFIDDFLIYFNIQVDTVNYRDHFAPESFGWILKKFRSKEEKPLKVKHLVQAYLTKKWAYFV